MGEDEIIQQIKDGKISFDRCFAHPSSMQKIAKEGPAKGVGTEGVDAESEERDDHAGSESVVQGVDRWCAV